MANHRPKLRKYYKLELDGRTIISIKEVSVNIYNLISSKTNIRKNEMNDVKVIKTPYGYRFIANSISSLLFVNSVSASPIRVRRAIAELEQRSEIVANVQTPGAEN